MIVDFEKFELISKADGLRLSGLYLAPEGEIRGIVQIAHGMAEHKERYMDFMRALEGAGYASCIHDHRGHGESVKDPSDLGYFYENGDVFLVDDLLQATEFIKARHPGKKLCLFGHSMGSMAVRAYLKRFDDAIDALVVCGCPSENPAAVAGLWLARALSVFQGERKKSALMNRMMFGAFAGKFPGETAFSWLNTDKDAVKAYEDDPLCGFLFTLNGYQALIRLMTTCYDKNGYNVKKPDLPILFISGGDDPCMIDRRHLDEAAEHLRRAGYRVVDVKVYEKLRHEILLAPERLTVYRDVIRFLDERLH